LFGSAILFRLDADLGDQFAKPRDVALHQRQQFLAAATFAFERVRRASQVSGSWKV